MVFRRLRLRKSTALRMTAGLEEITSGRQLIDDQVVNARPPQEPRHAMVFQDYALYPHMSVRQNMGFALRMIETAEHEIRRRVDEAAETAVSDRALDRRPKNSQADSANEWQWPGDRARPEGVSDDEPCPTSTPVACSDASRDRRPCSANSGVTTCMSPHDQVEAMTMGDRVASC